MEKEPKRMFKRVNVLGLDFYVDWLDVDGYCVRLISVKDVHGGRSFVYTGLEKDGVLVEDMLLNACGVRKEQPKEEPKEEVKEEKVEAEAPAAQETEQPKENMGAKTTKKRNKRS